jgi:hypothetical protein
MGEIKSADGKLELSKVMVPAKPESIKKAGGE